MAEKSEALEFEAAAKIRDQIQAVEKPSKSNAWFPTGEATRMFLDFIGREDSLRFKSFSCARAN